MADKCFVIALSGPAGADKTTLVQAVAGTLDAATTLFYDDYATVAHWHPDVLRWIAEGCVLDEWVQIPQMTMDRAIRRSMTSGALSVRMSSMVYTNFISGNSASPIPPTWS